MDAGAGNDVIIGSGLADTLRGGNGNDVITGAAGADLLSGGAGSDKFVFNSLIDSPAGAANADTITDFVHASDKIDFTAISGITKNATLVTSAGAVAAHGISYYQSGTSTVVIANASNTANHVDIEIHFTGFTASSLTASDFLHI